VVLVNHHTASAAEIISGSLQDLEKAYIIGQPTFGKATLMEQFSLSDESMVRLAIGRFYLPSGRCPQKSYESFSLKDSEKKAQKIFKSSKGRKLVNASGIEPDLIINVGSNLEESIQSHGKEIADKISLEYIITHPGLNWKEPKNVAGDIQFYKWVEESVQKLELDSNLMKHRDWITEESKFSIVKQIFGSHQEERARLLTDPVMNAAMNYIQQ
jgi:carboxyl-terminal processing protease